MNIPFSILKEKKLDLKCFEYHQTLAKRYYNSIKLNKSSNQKKPNKYSKKKIYNWFFVNLDIKQKLKVCSIYNDWFIKILEQLLTYNDYDNKIKFKPKEIYTNFYKALNNDFKDNYFDYSAFLNKYRNENKEPQEYFNTFFEIKENDDGNRNENKKTYMEKTFLNELVFFSLNKKNDILSLSEELLNNREKLQEYFDQFSNCKIFSENIKVNKEYNNIYNFSLPNWVKDFEEGFSIHQLILICFEISISIYYQLFLIENALPKFEIDSKIEDLYNMKLNMENYLAKETSKEKNPINSILDYKQLDSEVNSEENEKIYKDHEAITEYVYKIAFDRNQSSFYTDPSIKIDNINNAIINLKKELKINIPNFVDTITFIKANIVFKIQNILYNIIYQKIASLYYNRNLDELCNDINEIPKAKKKKKKNKKNKNEKKEDGEEKNKNSNEINLNLNESNEFNNIDDNKYSINCVENKNNSNNSDEEDDEENHIFSNDCSNEFNNSNNINSNEENNKECIEMKDLDEKGKEIINLENKKNKSEIDLIEEYINGNSKEKKNKRKKKKHKNKNKNNNIEIKKEESKEEKENNINNNINKTEINSSSNINEKKENNNIEQIKEENKNKKYKEKYKDFYLFPTNKDKKNKNINNNNNSNNKNNLNKNNIINKDNLIIINQESKEIKSKTTSTLDITEKNENNIINGIYNINDKCLDLFKTKENNIEILGNKNKNEISIKTNDKSNKIEHNKEHSKIQNNINLNNSTINNYVIIDKNNDLPRNIIPQMLTPFNYSIPFYQLPNFYIYERSDLFDDLTKEIISYEENITNNLKLLDKFRRDIYEKIKIFIENILNKNNFEAELINYGSHETGLSTEFSDIDILIKFCKKFTMSNISLNNQQNIEEILSLIYNELNLEKEKFNIIQINAIYTASVPVLKIKFDLDKIIPSDIKKKIKDNYLFNFEEEILQLNFDFTFQEVENMDTIIKIPSLEIINFIKGCLYMYKEIKPIILILKRYMKINKLNSSFHGGLSSYSLFLLLYSYIKSMYIQNNTIGHYLYGFFEFYSNFNFGIYLINSKLDCPFILLDELHESGMMLIDPITSLNVSKSTFRIDQIKSVLTKGMVIIRNIFLTNKGKNFIFNINSDNKYIFLDELFKCRNGVMILDKIIPQMQINNQNVIGKWKNV